MEVQIREELEAEYLAQRPAQQHDDEEVSKVTSNTKALEEQLRRQLLQVKDERERWTREQDEIQKKVMDSQQQFEKVRDGFKKKVDKEKARSIELQKENEEQHAVLENLSNEHQASLERIKELEKLILSVQESPELKSGQQLEAIKQSLLQQHQVQMAEMSQREEEYSSQIQELQDEINNLINEQTTHETKYAQWEEEKQALAHRYNDKNNELKRAMDDLETLNSENEEYLRKVEEYERTADSLKSEVSEYEEVNVKYR